MNRVDTQSTHVRSGTELKYIVPASILARLQQLLMESMQPDPYGDGKGVYNVASLYLDTPELSSYTRIHPGKWRVRRYGLEDIVHLEYKEKPENGKVVKHRSEIHTSDLNHILQSVTPKWFVKELHNRTLRPTQMVSYTRRAYFATIDSSPLRVTLDEDIFSKTTAAFDVPHQVVNGVALLSERILEVKFTDTIPPPFDAALTELGLTACSFSKYRTAMQCAGH